MSIAIFCSSVALMLSFSHHSWMDGGPLFLPEHDVDRLLADQLGRERHVLQRIVLPAEPHPAGDDAGFHS